MGYYTRIFCKSNLIPSIKDIFNYVKYKGYDLKIEKSYSNLDINNNNWEEFEFIYKKNRKPIIVEINKENDKSNLFKEEIDEFLEAIGEPRLSFSKKKVIKHLKKTKYIVVNQLLTSDIDDDGYDANAEFLQYFVDFCKGMIQADGEGFYSRNKIIVPLE